MAALEAACNGVVHSVVLDGSSPLFRSLIDAIRKQHGLPPPAVFTLSYVDDEGDSCTIGSEDELREGIRFAAAADHSFRVNVNLAPGTVPIIAAPVAVAPVAPVPAPTPTPAPVATPPPPAPSPFVDPAETAPTPAPSIPAPTPTPTPTPTPAPTPAPVVRPTPTPPRDWGPPAAVPVPIPVRGGAATATPVSPAPAPRPLSTVPSTPPVATPAPTPTPVTPSPAPAPVPVTPTPAPVPTPVTPAPTPAPAPVTPSVAPVPAPVTPAPVAAVVVAAAAAAASATPTLVMQQCPICSRSVESRELNRHLDDCLSASVISGGEHKSSVVVTPAPATPPPAKRVASPVPSPAPVTPPAGRGEWKEEKRGVGAGGGAGRAIAPSAPFLEDWEPGMDDVPGGAGAGAGARPPAYAPQPPGEDVLPVLDKLDLVLQRSRSGGERPPEKKLEEYKVISSLDRILGELKAAALASGAAEEKLDTDDLRTRIHEVLVLALLEQQLDRETAFQWERRRHEETVSSLQFEDLLRREREKKEKEEELSRIRIEEMDKREREEAEVRRKTHKEADEYSAERIKSEAKMTAERKRMREEQEKAKAAIVGKYLPGEESAMGSGSYRCFTLLPNSRAFGDLAEYHYRYAESQFLRLTLGQEYKVTQVDYVVNPPFVKAFLAKQKEFERRGIASEPVLCFHGTTDTAIDSILRTNFDVSRLGSHTGNRGAYGAGIYFSEYSATSLAYNRGARRLLLSKVLMGRPFQCTRGMLGAPLTRGHDCHVAPGGHEIVIYDNRQCLPCYVVTYESTAGSAAAVVRSRAAARYERRAERYDVYGNLLPDEEEENYPFA